MTNMNDADGTVLKTDAAGRVKTPPERRESLLDEFEQSGLSGAKFAQLAGIKYQTFAAWVALRRKKRGPVQPVSKPVEPVRWLEAIVADKKDLVPVRLQFSSGAWIELSDCKQIELAAALIHAVSKPVPSC